MKLNTHNRWLKIVVWLWVLVIVVMLLIPSELTDAQLAQIKPGMAVEKVIQLLGEPCKKGICSSFDTNKRFIDQSNGWHVFGKLWRPNIYARIPDKTNVAIGNAHTWVGKSKLLWVEHENGLVTKTWLFPITRSGGGLQGCIDTIREYWNKWWGK